MKTIIDNNKKAIKEEIRLLVKNYSLIYCQFEKLQNENIMPRGDQKTGVIAEYYAKLYIENHLGFKCEFAKSGESYDISYKIGLEKEIRVQVKGVSAHSKTRIIAPLSLYNKQAKPAFDFLYLIDLNLEFIPIGFYINSYKQVTKNLNDPLKKKVQGTTMMQLTNNNKASKIYNFKENKVGELIKVI
jgi:hypothetical protein